MNRKLVPYSFWSFPSVRFPLSLLSDTNEEMEGMMQETMSDPSGLAVSEDNDNVYIEAHVPGIKFNEIEITYERGILWIKGDKKEEIEDKKRKFYRKAMRSFSYQIAVPGDVDENTQPEATCKDGVLKVIFRKKQKSSPKKISVKEGK